MIDAILVFGIIVSSIDILIITILNYTDKDNNELL